MSKDSIKEKLHEVIFEADTPSGKAFDIALLVLIAISVFFVMIETVPSFSQYGGLFEIAEWTFTIIFTVEYLLRIYSVRSPWKYATSFYGVIDLVSILPTYLGLIFTAGSSLMVVRALRLLRVFRIFKLVSFMKQSDVIVSALKASRAKIGVFLFFVILMVTLFGSLMYVIEGPTNDNFDSIPRSIYWAIVTLTTVGYGDISPITPIGQFLASAIMIAGYAVIAVPTGIVTSEVMNANEKFLKNNTQSCRNCSEEGHDDDAKYCKKCGYLLNEDDE